MILSAANTYSGATTIDNGDLRVTGSIANSPVNLNGGGTLSGTGRVFRVDANGVIAPGPTVGTLETVDRAQFGGGSEYQVEVDGNDADRLDVGDEAIINNSTTLDISLVGGRPAAGQTYTIMTTDFSDVNGTFETVDVHGGRSFDVVYEQQAIKLIAQAVNPTISTSASPGVEVGGQVNDRRRSPAATPRPARSPSASTARATRTARERLSSPTRRASQETAATPRRTSLPTQAGTYRWVASYSGDAANTAISGACGDANETVTVSPAPDPPCRTLHPTRRRLRTRRSRSRASSGTRLRAPRP